MERRRCRAAKMFEKGCAAPDVAKRLGVARVYIAHLRECITVRIQKLAVLRKP